MMFIRKLTSKILEGYQINREEALLLVDEDLNQLTKAANQIRGHYNGNSFDMCTIINGKSGRCSEDCKFCSQSSHFKTSVNEYELLEDELVETAKKNEEAGILRYSVVTSGKRLSDSEIQKAAKYYRRIKEECGISLCASHGLLKYEDFVLLKESGVTRYHNNLETSRRFFPYICTTHSYDDKIDTIKAAQRAGLSVCSGGIMGMGESYEDRIDMALELRDLGIDSIPINILNPINGTPFGENPLLHEDDIRRIVAIYRFVHPKSAIRMAGGRGLIEDKGRKLFCGGANATISGDMLTTTGIKTEDDIKMVEEIGYILNKLD